jgi:hypothetical protein
MTKLKRLTVADYKMLSKKKQYCDDATDIFSGEISGAIAYLQDILDEGYTHLDSEKWIDNDYGHEFAVCETKYYRLREETDEEYQKRSEEAKERNEREKLKKEAKKKVRETLTPEQIKVLGL